MMEMWVSMTRVSAMWRFFLGTWEIKNCYLIRHIWKHCTQVGSVSRLMELRIRTIICGHVQMEPQAGSVSRLLEVRIKTNTGPCSSALHTKCKPTWEQVWKHCTPAKDARVCPDSWTSRSGAMVCGPVHVGWLVKEVPFKQFASPRESKHFLLNVGVTLLC